MVAHSRLAELESEDPKSEQAPAIAAECRFAFEQAIRLWADNPAAQGGLQRCLELTLRVEIVREHLAAARTLLAAMHDAAPEDEQAVEALAGALDARVRDASALAHERREADVSVASTIRRRLLFGMLFVGAVFGASTTFGKGTRPDDIVGPFSLAPIGLILLSGVTGFWVLRHKLFVNRANRRLAVILIGELVFSLVQRGVSVAVGETVAVVARTDMLLLTGTMFAAGVNLSRAWVVFSVVLLAAGGVMQVWPELTNAIFITSHMASLVVLALGWGNTAKA